MSSTIERFIISKTKHGLQNNNMILYLKTNHYNIEDYRNISARRIHRRKENAEQKSEILNYKFGFVCKIYAAGLHFKFVIVQAVP